MCSKFILFRFSLPQLYLAPDHSKMNICFFASTKNFCNSLSLDYFFISSLLSREGSFSLIRDNQPVPDYRFSSDSDRLYNLAVAGAQQDAPSVGNGASGLVSVLVASLEISEIGED